MLAVIAAFLVFAVDAADTGSISIPAMTGLAGAASGGAFSLWLSRHFVTVVIPKMQDQHAAAIEVQEVRHASALEKRDVLLDKMQSDKLTSIDKISTDFRAELREMRASHKSDLIAMWSESKETSRLMVAALNNLTTELRQVDRTMQGAGGSGILQAPSLSDVKD